MKNHALPSKNPFQQRNRENPAIPRKLLRRSRIQEDGKQWREGVVGKAGEPQMSLGKTKGLHRIMEDQGDSFEKEYTYNGLPMFWIRQKRAKLRNRIGAKKSFYNGKGEKNRRELNLSGENPKPIAAEERGRGFEAEKKKKAGTCRRFGGRKGCHRKRNGKRPSKWANI